jgi:TP901 family phage tail tape measure protein
VAFVLDVNLRIKDILGLQKAEAALSKLQGTTQVGVAAAGGAIGGAGGAAAATKVQAAAALANAAAINKVTVANNKLTASQSKAVGATRKAADGMKVATQRADTFGKSVAIAGKRYAAFLAATVVPFAALGGISKATATVIEFDSAMLKMRQITGQTEQQMMGMRNTILDLATTTGTSASEIARIGKIMSQAGFRGEQLSEALTALSKVPLTPSFETMDAAVEGTIAALNQFNKEGLTTTEILDVLTAVANKFAASSEDIAKGTARGGAAFEAIGGTFKEFVAIFATIRQATRESAETVGTFMKTISSRLADPKIVRFLEGKGIRIAEAIEAGDPVTALKRIAAAMENITSIQDRVEIGTKLGGRRQISRLLALMSNIDVLDNALKTAGASAGAFGNIAEEGLKGLQAQLNILVQELNKLVQTLAEPLFVPIIRGVTKAGKAFVSFLDFIKPVIPALTTIIGFAAGFKLLAVSIGAAAKALAFMSTVGVGGGIPGMLGALSGAGGAAGATARERVQRRLAGGVGVTAGQTAVAGGVGARLAGGARAAATSPLGQLAVVAGIILAADKLSESFEEAGESSGILAAEFAKTTGILLVATSLLSGKSITGAIGSIVTKLGPFGAAIAAAVAALGIFTHAAAKAVDVDVQNIIDAAAQKVAEIKIKPIELGDREALQQAVGQLGIEAISGIQESVKRYDEGLSGFFATAYERVRNLFKGEGLITISDTQAQQMIEDIIGNNPQLLNEILRSAIEQFGAADIEVGLDQLISEAFGGNIEVAARIRQAMIAQLGGLDKIAQNIEQVQIDAKISVLANAVEKASRDFERLYIPVELSYELGLLSDAVGNAARAIETNVAMFDQLSQVVGRDVGVAKPGTEFSREAIERIAQTGGIGEFIDLSQFKELEGFTTDMARVGTALEEFMESMIKSKANADSLRSLLGDPQVDPFDVLGDYIDKFMEEYPEQIPPEAEAAFKAAAANLGQQLKNMLIDQAGVLPSTEEIQKAFQDVLGKQQPFYEAAIDTFKVWIDTQAKQINLALSAEELKASVDVSTSELANTILNSFEKSLQSAGADFQLPLGFKIGLMDANDAFIDLAQNGDIVGQILDKYQESYNRHAELNRKVAEAQKTGEGATLDLLNASKNAAVEVLNLQVALTQLAKILQQAPQALSERQEEQRQLPGFNEQAAAMNTKLLEDNNQQMNELIKRRRQFIEAQAAIDVSQAFEEPADIFAQALTESAAAVRAFTSALTVSDLQRGAGGLDVRTTPEGRVYTERKPVPEAQITEQQRVTDTKHLQAALFGGDIGNVMETLLQAAVETAESKVLGQLTRGRPEEAAVNKELAESFRDFRGFIYDIPKMIQESGLDPTEVARAAAEALQKQAREPGAREVEYIGAIKRTIGDLTTSLESLIERPEVGREPEGLVPQLTPAIQDYLQGLTPPLERVPEPEAAPRVFEDISASAADIQQAASETKIAADATTRSTEDMKIASTDIRTGGTDILVASQEMVEAANQMQAVVDIQREALIGQQEAAGDGTNGESAREAMAATTEAVNALGERVDSVVKAVEIQTQQEAELASTEREKPLEIAGLENNTDAIAVNSDVTNKAQENMAGLNEGMNKVAGAMDEGIGIDIDTMSSIKIDVQGVASAAKEFTSEFEAVAHKVAKEEIRAVLQQLARTAGNSEAASTFESAIT